jgi:Ca2+-binding EF-hand superfamily protein
MSKKSQDSNKAFTLPNKEGLQTKLSYQDFERMMKEMGEDFSQKDLDRVVEDDDHPQGTMIDYPQYMEILRNKNRVYDSDLLEQFKAFDVDDDGSIPVKDFKMILMTTGGDKLNLDEIDEFIDKIEKDEDGNILYREFLKNFKFEY